MKEVGSAPKEIERKFLTRNAIPFERAEGVEIRQGYLSRSAREEVRIRQAGNFHTLTVKQGNGLQRIEVETRIDQEQFESLWQATASRRVSKTRYHICLIEDSEAHVDVYAGHLDGLITVEVEFASTETAAAFTPPDWFALEVTDDVRYSNKMLSTCRIPEN